MSVKIIIALAAVLAAGSVSTALADSVDGKPLDRGGRQSPASVRGSPSIIFENRGAVPLGTCASVDGYGAEDGYGGTRLCGAGGAF
ncbi:MAG TPA: hypothetical protein VGZ49_13685 [Xanthobacteraceae bacterium]|jgi:hypothetical protein|nr:hypothetical protein [Xanthobacteraceae bacterium]